MQIGSVNGGQTLAEAQVQKNIQKLFVTLSGSKTSGASATTKFLTDAGNVFLTVKRIGRSIGEKSIIPRLSLAQLIGLSAGIKGFAYSNGSDAATSYGGAFTFDLSLLGNIRLESGDYISVTCENNATGTTCALAAVAGATTTGDHCKVSKITLQPSEQKRVNVNFADYVAIPQTVIEARFVNTTDSFTLNGLALGGLALDNMTPIFSMSGGGIQIPELVVIPAHEVEYVDLTNGSSVADVLIVRQKDYSN